MQINTSEVSVKSKENENIKIRQVTESIRFYIDNPSSKPAPIATQRSENKDQPKNDNKNSSEAGSEFKTKLLELIIKEIYDKEFDKIYSNLNKSNNIPNKEIDDPNWKIKYDKREILQKNIEKQLNSNGVINTSDGKQINFNIFLQLEFNNNYSGLSKTDLDYKDGFKINYNAPSELLNFENFEFELSKLDIPSKYPFINGGKGELTFEGNQNLSLSKSNINLQNSNETLDLSNFADLEIPPNGYVRLNNYNASFVSNINADNLYKRNNSPSKNILDLSF